MVLVRRDALGGLIYKLSLVAFPAAAIVGVLGTLLIGFSNLAILGLYLAAPLLLASAVVWRSPVHSPASNNVDFYDIDLQEIDWRLLSITFHFVVCLLVVLVVSTDVRPIAFYGGVALLYTLTFLFAVSARGPVERTLCLYHATVAVMLVIFSVTLNYELFVGRTDLTAHISFTLAIIETGRFPVGVPTYEPFLLWHVLTAGAYDVTGGWLRPSTTMFVLGGLLYGVGVPAMYGFARRLYPNVRVATLSAVMMICFPLYIFYGMYSIPRSTTSILFLILLLSLVIRPTASTRILTLLLVTGIVVYHPVSIPFVLIILTMLFVVERILDARDPIVDKFTLISAVTVTTIYWLFRADFLVSRLVGTIVVVLTYPSPETTPTGVEMQPWVEAANYVPYSFLLFFLLVGFLFWYRNGHASIGAFGPFALVAVALVPLVFPGPTLLLDELAGVNVGRFAHYSFMFVALTAGVGVFELLRRGGIRTFFVVLLLVSCLSFTAVSNDFVASDNPVVERPFYTYYFTEHERASFERIEEIHAHSIATDWPACRYLSELGTSECEAVAVDEGDGMFDEHDSVLIREHESEKRPLRFTRYVYADELDRTELTSRNKVHDSGAITLYV